VSSGQDLHTWMALNQEHLQTGHPRKPHGLTISKFFANLHQHVCMRSKNFHKQTSEACTRPPTHEPVSAVSYPMSCQATPVTDLIRAVSSTVAFESTQVARFWHLYGRKHDQKTCRTPLPILNEIIAKTYEKVPFHSHTLVQDGRCHRSACM
jgi:hypothetical protein